MGTKVTIERHEIDDETFMERIFKQKDGIERFFNRKPKTLLIGAEDYAELMHEVVSSQEFRFNAEYWYTNQPFGLNVRVIPWMRGILVMP